MRALSLLWAQGPRAVVPSHRRGGGRSLSPLMVPGGSEKSADEDRLTAERQAHLVTVSFMQRGKFHKGMETGRDSEPECCYAAACEEEWGAWRNRQVGSTVSAPGRGNSEACLCGFFSGPSSFGDEDAPTLWV